MIVLTGWELFFWSVITFSIGVLVGAIMVALVPSTPLFRDPPPPPRAEKPFTVEHQP